MKKKALSLIIGLMSLSLLGLIGLQAYWVRHAITVKQEQFDRSVNDALNQVVHQLEVRELANGLQKHLASVNERQQPPSEKLAIDQPQEPGKSKKSAPAENTALKKTVQAALLAKPAAEKHTLVTGSHSPDKVVFYRNVHPEADIKIFGFNKEEEKKYWHLRKNTWPDRSVLNADSLQKYGHYRQTLLHSGLDSFPVIVRLHHDSVFKMLNASQVTVIKDAAKLQLTDSMVYRKGGPVSRKVNFRADTLVFINNTRKNPENFKPAFVREKVKIRQEKQVKPVLVKEEVIKRKENQVNQVMEKMVMELVTREVPLRKRLDFNEVDSLIAAALSDKNISLPYAVAIADNQTDTLLHLKQVNTRFARNQPQYRVSLFPNDLVHKPGYLMLQFPDKQEYVLGSMFTMLSASAAFILIMILTFGATLGFIFKQKKISEIKSDFINNMTHEFKTPIATISLATDAINSPKVLSDSSRICYYTAIIQQENKRMLNQVENVLQMALLDRQDLKLNFETIELKELLEQALDKLKLQVESRQGQLKFSAGSGKVKVLADKLHLENVFLNLLDNANKYSPEAPDITVHLQVKNDRVYVTISDRGIGMTTEVQKRVFDKFYRVPTGNLHNVKGFGLGLAYVKIMVEQHKGQVIVKSSAGNGSSFQVCLPVIKA